MRGYLLTKTRKLVKGLAKPTPVWLKAMEEAPPVTFPLTDGKIKKIEMPEDVYVKRFYKKHPDSLYHDAVKKEMGSETMRIANVYRQLLKAVDKHLGGDGGKRHFRDYIVEEFHKNAMLSDQTAAHNKLKLARDYTFLLNSVHHHKDLLFSYNIAVDRSEEMKKILNKSAASVGLKLPDVYQP
ncbi:uncharacterized protein [Typha angustifolia]